MSRFPRPGRTPRPRPVPTAGPTPTPSPTPGPGTTFTLTTNIETVPASGVLPANSTVTGVIAGSGGSAAGSTYQTGDIINANQTSDVKVTVANGGVPAQVVAINNAGSVQFRNVAGASQDVNAVLFSGVTQVGSFGSLGNSDLAITNGDIASRYALINPTAQATNSVADLAVGFVNATGTADVAKFSVENVGFAATASGVTTVTNAALTVTGNTAESANIATTGTNFFRPTIGSAATSLAITGSGNNSVTLASGDLTNNAKTVTFAAASGANALELGSFVRAGDTYTGGSGVDVLGITPAGLGATALNVSGFETLALQSGAAAGILGFAAPANFQRVNVLPLAGTNTTITLSNAGAIPALNFVGVGATAAQNFNSVSAPTSGTVNASFAGGSSYELGDSGAITLNGATTINLAIAGTAAGQGNLNGDTVASTSLVTFTASGTGALSSTTSGTPFNINGSGGTAQNLQSINLSGLTGTAVSQIQSTNNSFTALSVTAAPGGTTYTPGVEGNTDVVTFTGGLGADTLTATTYLGLANFTGGAGTDTVQGNNSTNAPGIIFAQGGSGADTLIGGSAADTLQGDADNDLINGRIGLDVVSGGTGQDTFRYQESRTTDIDTITDFAFGAAADNISYTGSTGFVFGNATATFLNNVNGDAVGTSATAVLATFGGGAAATPNTSVNFLQLTSTSSSSFAAAIGTNGIAIASATAFNGTDSLGAVYFDSTNQQAVFGFITNTTVDGNLNSSDTFTEVARAATSPTAYASLVASNVTFF